MDPIRVPLLKQLRPAHWVAIDCAVTALLALVSTVVFKEAASLRGIPHWAAAAIIAAGVLPAAARRRWPAAVLALVTASAAVATAISTSPGPALVVVFVIYLIPLRFSRREALWLLAGTLLVTGAGLAAFLSGPHVAALPGAAVGLLLASGLLITTAWLIGYCVRQQRSYSAGLREEAERRAGEQLAQAHRARTEERLQIARELHDVVAHTMSLIAVQAGVANYVASARPDEAARALASIEETSRGALGEMRALLGILRADGSGPDGSGPDGSGPDGGEADAGEADAGEADAGEADAGEADAPALPDALAPTPGLADLDSLVKRTAEAGVRVQLDVCGERPRLSAGLDLAAYRVIQEAVTNVIRHATTDRCHVTVAYQADALTLEVVDAGAGPGGPGGGRAGGARAGGNGNSASASGNSASGNGGRLAVGHGIVGMRERVGMYGGEFGAAPLPGRGFRVTARFPLAGPGLSGAGPPGAGLPGAGLPGAGA